jgi:probable HAF family extracellular repeat protein
MLLSGRGCSGILRHRHAVAIAIAGLILPFSAGAQTPSLIDLGASTSAYGINASGQIAGCITITGGASHAFLYDAGVTTDLGTLGGNNSCGYALNAGGQVTGYADTAAGAVHAFLYAGGSMTDLGTVAGTTETVGTAINTSGAVIGYATANGAGIPPISPMNLLVLAEYFGQTGPQASTFLYQQGTMTQLLSDPVMEGSIIGTAINDGGAVAGIEVYPVCGIPCPDGGAFLYLGGTNTPLNTPSLFIAGATAINTAGVVVGWGEDADAYDHALVFANGGVTDLGDNMEAFAVNSSGQVVGASNVGLYDTIGPAVGSFLYSQGTKTNLNIPGGVATGINDSGWIIANNPTLNHAYLLRPSSVSLTPTGLSFGNGVIGAASSSQTAPCGACTVTLTNGTGVAIAVGGLTVIGPFASTSNSCPASLAARASCTVNLSFTPSAPDASAGAMSITAGGTSYAALLTGIGMNTIKLTASASTVAIGVPFTLTWSGTSGASCSATGGALAPNNAPLDAWTGTKPASGSLTLSETAAAALNFTLTCTDGSQTATAKAPVTIEAPTISLHASTASVAAGQSATLSWTSSYAGHCVASGGGSGDGWSAKTGTSGSTSVEESTAGSYTYTMTCTSGSVSVKASAQIVFDSPAGGGGAMGWPSIAWLALALAARRARRRPD